MTIAKTAATDKIHSAEQILSAAKAEVQQAAAEGVAEHVTEKQVLTTIVQIGRALMDEFFAAQGDGDLGSSIAPQGRRLQRSSEPASRKFRTIFGEHVFDSFVYATGPKKAIECRPLDERMGLPKGRCSYVLEELSQYLCVQEAFGKSRDCVHKFFGVTLSVNTLENINGRMGPQAAEFLAELPTPPVCDEGELLVATADGKGVPLLNDEVINVPAFEDRERKGNKRMATLGCVYSVDRYVRTTDDILMSLFRDEPKTLRPERPKAKFKHLSAHFASSLSDGDETINVPGSMNALSWIATEVSRRRQSKQPLVVVMDGQRSLWDASAACLDSRTDDDTIEILDLLHVSQYVWKAAAAFHCRREDREAFTRKQLRRVLDGQVKAVVTSLRQRASKRKLTGKAKEDVRKACNYFSNNLGRMRYDEYLASGYPIASGVIEGACRHLVKDRMERTGMRWRLDSATAMLNTRSVFISEYWETFQQTRIYNEQLALGRDPKMNKPTAFPVAA